MNRRYFPLALVFLIFLTAFTSCDLFTVDDVTPIPEYKVLISKKLVNTYPAAFVKTSIEAVESKYSQATDLSNYVKNGFFVYQITYRTEFINEEVLASGIVCVPMASGTFPLLSFQNGTNTLHSKAPSVAYTDTLFYLIQTVSSFGFVVAMPDYLGFGASNDMYHPYLHKASTNQTVTDMFRAIVELMEDYPKTFLSKDTYLIGYSQGGWATMALKKELETNPVNEFTLKATSCGAGPYDLTLISKKILEQTTYPMPFFMGYVVNSYIKSGETTLTYGDIFKSPYSGTNYISDLYDGNKNSGEINSKLTTTVSDLFQADLISNFTNGSAYSTLRNALANNSVTAWKTTSPLLLVHGLADSFVTPVVSNNIYLDFLASGTTLDVVTYFPIPALDHSEAVIPWGLLSLKWILEKKG